MAIKRTATAHWAGDLKSGKGHLSTPSSTLQETQYSYRTRFEDGKGTNPEELLAASHAGCFTMAMSLMLGQAGFQVTALDTVATVSMEGLDITGVHLSITGKVPGISADQFKQISKQAEQGCIISKALKVPITSDATLN